MLFVDLKHNIQNNLFETIGRAREELKVEFNEH